MNNNQIVIDDGSKVYDIVNKRKEVLGQFTFIPSDLDITKRYDQVVAAFEQLSEKAEKEILEIEEAEEEMKKQIDYLFKADVSGSFFKITSPFTLLENGEFFVENILNAVRLIVEKEMDVNLKKAQKRVSKYTQKYHK